MPAQQQHHVTTAYLSSGSVAVGQCAVKTAAGDGYVEATLDNRTAASRRTAGIAISAGDPNNVAFELQVVGEVPPSISGLGTGAAGPIRVSSTGTLERTTSYSASDDMCGRCDTDGTAYVCFPLIGLGSAFGAVASASPTASVQVSVADGTFRGLTGVFGSVDGALEMGSAPFPTTGTERHGANALVTIRSRDDSRTMWRFWHTFGSGTGAPQADRFVYGANTVDPDTHEFYARKVINLRVTKVGDATRFSQVALWTDGPYTPSVNSLGVSVEPTLAIGPVLPFTTDIFRGAIGGAVMKYRTTAASGNPPTGWTDVYPDPSTGHLTQVLPDGTTFDLTDTGSGDEGDNVVITASPTDDIDVTGVGSIESHSASATVTIKSLTPPVAGKAKRVAISNQNGDSATLVLEQDNGFTEEGGFKLSTGGNFSMPFGMTLWAVYSETAQRYLVTVPSLEPGA